MKGDDCIFCKLANGDIPTNTIYEDADFRVILDASPAAKGHALILPKQHYANMFEMDDEVLAKAAKLANAHEFILMLKDGYDTVITNNGEHLSQGQRQLLSIASAAIADPPIMVLDEATSSIDTHTAALVQSGMDKLMENRTVFVIAHRLSTVRNSNAIMVLENGRIIERGDHDDLIALKGTYYNLYTGKSELS